MPQITPMVLLALMASATVAQDPPAPDPSLPERLKELKEFCSDRKMESDFKAIESIRALAKGFAKSHPKDRKKITKALGDVFFWGKARPPANSILYREAADALAVQGEDGAGEILFAVEHDRFKDRDYIPLRAHLLKDLGKTRDEKQVDFLLEQARRSPWDPIMAAAGEALGNYTDLDIRKRREIVKQLLIKLGAVVAKASVIESSDPNAPIDLELHNAADTLSRIEGPFLTTLSKLTGRRFSTFAEWQRWLNKNPDWTPAKAK